MAEIDSALEPVGVVLVPLARRLGPRQREQLAQLGQEELVVGALRAAGVLPARDDGVDGCGGGEPEIIRCA
ncbi:MAG TPA: hypothetical protein DCL01_06350 [Thauera sp.]|nr:hypothetical protein [Thauera sp.]